MFWLSLLVLMLLIAAAPGISMYVEHRSGIGGAPNTPSTPGSGDPFPKR